MIAIVALVISLGAQLMVPQMIQNILDAIVGGMAAQQVATLPPENQAEAMINAGIDPAQFDRLLNSAEMVDSLGRGADSASLPSPAGPLPSPRPFWPRS